MGLCWFTITSLGPSIVNASFLFHCLSLGVFMATSSCRIRTFLIEGWFCHSHYAAWHTLHNIIFGTAGKIDGYLEAVSDRLSCDVAVFHGRDDDLIPLDCSFSLKKKVPRAHVKVVDDKDHITIVVCRQKTFARELELIWNRVSS